MSKFSLTLLPALFGMVVFNGCDSSCCMDVPAGSLIAPTPVITLEGNPLQGTLTCDPATNEIITLTAASTDSDGQVVENIWKVDGVESGSVVSCPEAGKSKQICLVAVDNDNLKNETCVTLTAKTTVTPPQPTEPTPPETRLTKGTEVSDGVYLQCDQSHDTDTLHLYPEDAPFPYGSNTPKDIKEITYNYTYFKADDSIESGPFETTQTQFNEANDQPVGTCKKWFHTNNGVAKIEIKATALDDDRQTTTVTYVYDVASGTLTKQP